MFAQFPTLPSGAIETWLLCALAVGTIVATIIKLFVRKTALETEFVTKEEFRIFRAAVERDLGGLRDRIDSRHLAILEALDKLRVDLMADAERRAVAIHNRLNEAEATLARVDERTKHLCP
jgi:hypothetical protein